MFNKKIVKDRFLISNFGVFFSNLCKFTIFKDIVSFFHAYKVKMTIDPVGFRKHFIFPIFLPEICSLRTFGSCLRQLNVGFLHFLLLYIFLAL